LAKVKILVCIDDTDNLESIGTGHLAARLAADLEQNKWGVSSFITRHQLFVHPDVPYTSHNSAMCFEAQLQSDCLDRLIGHAADFLEKNSAEGSDPGLCIAVAQKLQNSEQIIDFGRKAKQQVLKKEEAVTLAEQYGIHLSEHGGTGGGVIGALAGVGLRLSGNDGRIRGKLQVANVDGTASVGDICYQAQVNSVKTVFGKTLMDEETICLGDKVKAVFISGKPVLLVAPLEPPLKHVRWRTCTRQELGTY
jgi:hypothetical protein